LVKVSSPGAETADQYAVVPVTGTVSVKVEFVSLRTRLPESVPGVVGALKLTVNWQVALAATEEQLETEAAR
jgi:hypothetical protein